MVASVTLGSLADNQSQIPQQHLSKSAHWLGVLIDVSSHEQDQLLVDHLVQRQQVFCSDQSLLNTQKAGVEVTGFETRHSARHPISLPSLPTES